MVSGRAVNNCDRWQPKAKLGGSGNGLELYCNTKGDSGKLLADQLITLALQTSRKYSEGSSFPVAYVVVGLAAVVVIGVVTVVGDGTQKKSHKKSESESSTSTV
jgi:hypothetical protein